jgi:hypothetical protein
MDSITFKHFLNHVNSMVENTCRAPIYSVLAFHETVVRVGLANIMFNAIIPHFRRIRSLKPHI